MAHPTRRTLLRGIAAGALAGAAVRPRIARAAPGDLDGGLSTLTSYKVLEIFLGGGADLWPAFYYVPGEVSNASWVNPYGLDDIAPADWAAVMAGCNPAWEPAGPTAVTSFDTSPTLGSAVHWGPATAPLTALGLDSVARVAVVGHEFPPHEGGVPLALTGTSLGRPIGFGLGAALNRNRPSGDAPVSFVIAVRDSGIPGYILRAASSYGFHGAGNRPAVIGCGSDHIHDQLDRTALIPGSTISQADGDTLRAYYDSRYRSMLRRSAVQTRSSGYEAYQGSLSSVLDFAGVESRLAGATFVPPLVNTAADNPTATAIRAAAEVLSAGGQHVTVVDIDWDAHENGLGGITKQSYAAYNLKKTLWVTHALAEVIDSGALDLSTTLVYIHSEFGRVHEGTNGGAHHPDGYPVVLLGGPIVNPGLVGDFGGLGTNPYTDGDYGVAAVRAAVALAAGLDPWHPDMYAQSNEWLGNVLSGYIGSLSSANIPVLETAVLGM